MAQLSRPYQIALGVVVLFALVWFVALNGHGSSSSSTPVAGTPAPTPAPAAQEKAVASSKIYHGAAPGVEGLTRDINRAHRSVAKTQVQEQRIAGTAGETKSQVTGASSSTTVVTRHGVSGTSTTVVTKHVVHTPAPSQAASKGISPQQAAVESELKQGKVVLVLFWNPKGADDVAVRKEVRAVGKKLGGKIAVHDAFANQVGSFGTFTKTVQVYGTPTILVINKQGAVTTLNGLTDAFAIEQTIDEARQES
jgi:hypothetical protein